MRQSKIHCVIPHFPASCARLPSHYRFTLTATPLRLLHCHQTNVKSQLTNYRPLSVQYPTRSPLPTTCRTFSTSTYTMASDDAYMSFLDKANADVSGDSSQQGSSVKTETVHSSVSVPKALQSVDVYYVSDTDEPFEPVALKWDGAAKGSWPSADQLSSLISPDTDLSQSISTLSPSDFDPQNQYSKVLDAVREAGAENDKSGELKIYRVEITSTKIEYWVLALHKPESRIVGLRAKAVES
ncbi:uncharacterized protein N7506_008919 [Penicillium brevicompactum]|uniref:uncharacterized protein n=1 Tax=Penicillium brevicompactum TaxID=5074 RepID=UPI00254259E9|nr:uncharacterized protein N7506_008919 [Penicillium brevicompactum]KAJ5325817.1 hypothetical protein N7506_008919 [Penicillium brevicompactum]